MVLHVITALLSIGLCYGMPPSGTTAAPTAYNGAAAQESLIPQQAHHARASLFPQQQRNPSYQTMGSYGSSLFDPSVFPVAHAPASQAGGLLGRAVARTSGGQANAGASSQNLMRSIMQNTMTGRLMGLDNQEIAHLNSVRTLGVGHATIHRLMKIDQIPSYNYYLALKNKPAQFSKAQNYLMTLNRMENHATDSQLEAMGARMLMQRNMDPDLARMVQLDAARGVYGDRLQRVLLGGSQMSLLG
ncbi:uncharacterized protein 1 [Haliotis asinina]|uniref:Uncharacterized protein 1 n=1 Tax=Haliotis asinina TaxID=109174 RepID=UP1_HALAI|nr:RecName: Full=Uncharacterized protein 1; Flags: Precursor [Haliotis asinina]